MKATTVISNSDIHVKKNVTLATSEENAKGIKPKVTVEMDFNGMTWGQVCEMMERGVIVPMQNVYRDMEVDEAKAWFNQLPRDENGNPIVRVKVKADTKAIFERPKTTEEKFAAVESETEDMSPEQIQALIEKLQKKVGK